MNQDYIFIYIYLSIFLKYSNQLIIQYLNIIFNYIYSKILNISYTCILIVNI